MLLFFCFVVANSSNVDFLLFFVRDSNMISLSAVEFRYWFVITILMNLGKP